MLKWLCSARWLRKSLLAGNSPKGSEPGRIHFLPVLMIAHNITLQTGSAFLGKTLGCLQTCSCTINSNLWRIVLVLRKHFLRFFFHIWSRFSYVQNVSAIQEIMRADPKLSTYLKGPLTRKIFISVNEAVPWVKTNGDTKSCYTYVQIGKDPQLPVAVLPRVSHFHDDITRGTVRRVNVLQMRIAAIFVLYSGSETLAYRR